jgi:hypothetical protein
MYIVGKPASRKNRWIARCKINACGDIYVDGKQMHRVCPLGEGSSGIVYAYRQGRKVCAVKHLDVDTVPCVCELGSHDFPFECIERNKHMVHTAVYTRWHIMEMGEHVCCQKANLPKMVKGLKAITTYLIERTMCYTDIKENNIVWVARGILKKKIPQLCDLDSISCIGTQTQKQCQRHTNRYTLYPMIKTYTDAFYTLPLISILQTWYSTILTLISYTLRAHRQVYASVQLRDGFTYTKKRKICIENINELWLCDIIEFCLNPLLIFMGKPDVASLLADIYLTVNFCYKYIQYTCNFKCVSEQKEDICALQLILTRSLSMLQ